MKFRVENPPAKNALKPEEAFLEKVGTLFRSENNNLEFFILIQYADAKLLLSLSSFMSFSLEKFNPGFYLLPCSQDAELILRFP